VVSTQSQPFLVINHFITVATVLSFPLSPYGFGFWTAGFEPIYSNPLFRSQCLSISFCFSHLPQYPFCSTFYNPYPGVDKSHRKREFVGKAPRETKLMMVPKISLEPEQVMEIPMVTSNTEIWQRSTRNI